jgi:sulfur carrier protein ThiS adenylyltransferase
MTIEEITGHLSKFTVGIAGAGGLGSNCAAALARSGVGCLKIADFDLVERSNLNRQFYFSDQVGKKKVVALKENLDRIGRGSRIDIYDLTVSSDNIVELFSSCDVIVEAFDRADMKEMLAETVLTKLPGRPLVLGSGMAGYGSTDSIVARNLGDNLWVCGDEQSEVSDQAPPMGARVGIVANMQANIVVEILMKMKR